MLYKEFFVEIKLTVNVKEDFRDNPSWRCYPGACEHPWMARIRHLHTHDTFYALGAKSPRIALELAKLYIDLSGANKERDRTRRRIERGWSLNRDERWS
jgi:hypothetical protein